MKRYISDKDEKYYTNMLKILNAIGGRNLDYNWLITDIEALPQKGNGKFEIDEEIYNRICDKEYVLISNDELLDILERNDFPWIWGVFSAIPKQYSEEDILEYDLPYADGNRDIYKDDSFVIQHPLADIEIVAFDSSLVHIVAKDDEIADKFKELYKEAKINY